MLVAKVESTILRMTPIFLPTKLIFVYFIQVLFDKE